ncbi:rho GTPase-activating protein 22 isoform X2 [Rhineura floridana]|uniref:rho GTPase-activating protein 22 isoform X2 n=1 Tax=Rhineura floridana TaxID=261503 RepID=UPI002AC88598|nr:rho GTPase-activating protein 22 isoform X2 [Rhineura floridana]
MLSESWHRGQMYCHDLIICSQRSTLWLFCVAAETLWTTDCTGTQNVSDAWSQDFPPLSLLFYHTARLLLDVGSLPLAQVLCHNQSNTDIHTVASPLKLYLRELPEPVIPFARYKDFLSCGQLLSKDKGEGTQELANHVKCLPQANYNLLKYVCKTQMHSQKMGENRKWLITEEWIR